MDRHATTRRMSRGLGSDFLMPLISEQEYKFFAFSRLFCCRL